MSGFFQQSRYGLAACWLPRSEWWIRLEPGLRLLTGAFRAARVGCVSRCLLTTYPTTRRDHAPSMTARKTNSAPELNVGEVSHPELVRTDGNKIPGQVGEDRLGMIAVRSDEKHTNAARCQVFLSHDPGNPLVVGDGPAASEFLRHPSVAGGRPFLHDLLDRCPQSGSGLFTEPTVLLMGLLLERTPREAHSSAAFDNGDATDPEGIDGVALPGGVVCRSFFGVLQY